MSDNRPIIIIERLYSGLVATGNFRFTTRHEQKRHGKSHLGIIFLGGEGGGGVRDHVS